MIEGFAFARAGLLGNPSDGYFGKVIAVSIKNFRARLALEDSPDIRIVPSADEEERYGSLSEFAEKVGLYGYYGAVRLIKAAMKKFYEYALSSGVVLPRKNFTVRFTSDIPRQIGLGGSSAIITATMRALMNFYELTIPIEAQPGLILGAERDELDINAGLQDRVTQVYEGCLYMDFDRDLLRDRGYGRYERLDADLLPPLYLAYKPALGKVSGRVLNEIRIKVDRGDPFTLETLKKLAGLADQGRAAILEQDHDRLSRLINENFDLRRSIMTIHPANQEMIDTARGCGASSHFAGSGGSILGTFKDEVMFERLLEELGRLGAIVVKPIVF
ncbi:MAG: GHMP kinase [Candidatus Aminicenantes bacterium]|nr:GHMP kinase [Candidatus Aminicenantes bacterium]